jgi:hypothetical protein
VFVGSIKSGLKSRPQKVRTEQMSVLSKVKVLSPQNGSNFEKLVEKLNDVHKERLLGLLEDSLGQGCRGAGSAPNPMNPICQAIMLGLAPSTTLKTQRTEQSAKCAFGALRKIFGLRNSNPLETIDKQWEKIYFKLLYKNGIIMKIITGEIYYKATFELKRRAAHTDAAAKADQKRALKLKRAVPKTTNDLEEEEKKRRKTTGLMKAFVLAKKKLAEMTEKVKVGGVEEKLQAKEKLRQAEEKVTYLKATLFPITIPDQVIIAVRTQMV